MIITSKLALGPMSSEIIEAIFKYSHLNNEQIMLIASKNQIDYNGGYVNNWTTKDYMQNINKLKSQYINADIVICRDHCGPGFNGILDLDDTYNTMKSDIENGFDLIHIDFCHIVNEKERMKETLKSINYCKSLNPNILFEVGTDENIGKAESNSDKILNNITQVIHCCQPVFYVIQTGSLIKEIYQIGNFNIEQTKENANILNKFGIKIKEHNADYLSIKKIALRKDIVGAMNVAPQLGYIQTKCLLQLCKTYNIDSKYFESKCVASHKWDKWIIKPKSSLDKFDIALICGHYNFMSQEYFDIVEKLNIFINFNDIVQKHIFNFINMYLAGLNGRLYISPIKLKGY